MIENIYATCIEYQKKGILFIGDSGRGKSDLALRMIMDKGALLVADDRTDVFVEDNVLIASCPEKISGLLEVRGVGICHFPPQKKTEIKLVVELLKEPKIIERMPEPEQTEILGQKIKKIRLWAFEPSAPDKVILSCNRIK